MLGGGICVYVLWYRDVMGDLWFWCVVSKRHWWNSCGFRCKVIGWGCLVGEVE